jgi:hypothetical protein
MVLKRWIRGEALSRPLLMPIIFSLGSRMQSMKIRDFQSNPTRICQSLQQIRATLKVDGLACYFDPYLEAEALGCTRELRPDGSCTLACPPFSGIDDLRQKSGPAEALGDKENVRIVCNVLQRLKVMLKDQPALMVNVTGPFSLAAQLLRHYDQGQLEALPVSWELVEFASEVIFAVASKYLEAGADVIVISENMSPELPAEVIERWALLLTPVINSIRFYEALPILLLNEPARTKEQLALILGRTWEGIWCLVLGDDPRCWAMWRAHGATPALGLPCRVFNQDLEPNRRVGPLREFCDHHKPAIVTSDGDVPAATDVKKLAAVLGRLGQILSAGTPV